MKTILIIAIVSASFGFLLVIFKLLKKGGKLAAKLPTNFLIFFLIYGLLGLTGFFLKSQVAANPFLISLLLFVVSLTGGIIMTNNLYEKWEWSMLAGFGKKLLYLFGITLTSVVAFIVVFLLCEHRGIPKSDLKSDLIWFFAGLITCILLPLLIKHLHLLWNDIPKLSQLKDILVLPVGSSPPFIEVGGAALNFSFVIPLDYRSKDFVRSKAAVPFNKSLGDAFHYKLHEHNIVKRYAKKIVLAENNKKSKLYGWCFYRTIKIWWGFWTKKYYLNPKSNIGAEISNGETVFVERVKIWEK